MEVAICRQPQGHARTPCPFANRQVHRSIPGRLIIIRNPSLSCSHGPPAGSNISRVHGKPMGPTSGDGLGRAPGGNGTSRSVGTIKHPVRRGVISALSTLQRGTASSVSRSLWPRATELSFLGAAGVVFVSAPASDNPMFVSGFFHAAPLPNVECDEHAFGKVRHCAMPRIWSGTRAGQRLLSYIS